MFGRRIRFREFRSLSGPLVIASAEGTPRVLLAFAITYAGDLVGMTVAIDGGQVSFDPVESFGFPAPIRASGPGQTVETTLGGNRAARRARGDA